MVDDGIIRRKSCIVYSRSPPDQRFCVADQWSASPKGCSKTWRIKWGASVWFMVAEGRVRFRRLIQSSPYEFTAINCVNNCVNAIIDAINCVILQDWMIL